MCVPVFLLLLEITVPDSKLGIRWRGKDKVGMERPGQHTKRQGLQGKTMAGGKDKE